MIDKRESQENMYNEATHHNEIYSDKIDINAVPPAEEPARQYYFMAKCRAHVRAESESLGRPLTCAVITFGCQMNTVSEKESVRII